MISARELCAFLDDMYKQMNDRAMWEFFINKVHNKSYSDWKAETFPSAGRAASAVMDKESIIADSLAISESIAAKEVTNR